MNRAAAVALATMVLSACGSTAAQPTPTPRPPTPQPTPVPSPTEAPSLTLTAVGLGAYELTTVPVAIVHNGSATLVATAVHVHFTVLTPAGRTVAQADADLATVPAATDGVAAARLDLAGTGDHATAAVTAVSWVQPQGVVLHAAAGACSGCPTRGAGFGNVVATLTREPAGLAPPASVDDAAACLDSAGLLVGGGADTTQPGADGGVRIPVILSRPAVRCIAWAAAGSF